MAKQPWLDEVQKRLAGSNLPPAYIRRFMEELSDHFLDLTEETMSTEANAISRLGEPGDVTQAAVTTYRHRNSLGRHPVAAFLAFTIAPIVAMAVLFVVGCLSLAAFVTVCEHLGFDLRAYSHRLGEPACCTLASLLTIIVPAVFLMTLYGRLAERWGIGRTWKWVAFGLLAVTAMLPFHGLRLSEIPGQSSWTIAAGVPPTSLPQVAQLIIPLLITWCFLRRRNPQRRPQVAM
jgi:uncharacterized membrane protein